MFNASVDLVRGLTWSETRDLFRFAMRRLKQEQISQVAGSLTFTTVLALVPLLTICFAIFTTFPVFTSFRSALDQYFAQSLMPKSISSTIVNYLTLFASKATRLSAVGAVALLLTTVAMLSMIEQAFNKIWAVRRPRPLSQRVLIYWAIVTLGPLLIGLSLTMTSQVYMATSGLMATVPFLGAMFYITLSVLLTTGAFTLLYMTIPNRYVDWRDALWGGLVAALAFEAGKRLFAVFIQQFPTYALIYGALAAVPLFLIWVYVSWMITLIGALLTAALPVVKYERWWHKAKPGDEFVDAMSILRVLHNQSRNASSALANRSLIRHFTRLGFDEMTALLEKMLHLGWVGRVHVEPPHRVVRWGRKVRHEAEHWVLLANLEQLRLVDVYRCFVFHAEGELSERIDKVLEQGLAEPLAAHFALNR